MARQENTGLRGRIGNLDFYSRNGGSFAKQASTSCRQTMATKEQSGVFGRASQVASLLWRYLKQWSAGYANNNAWNRLNRAVANWVRTDGLADNTPRNKLPYICGFQFNTTTALNERFRFSTEVSRNTEGMAQLVIPAINPVLNIAAPARTKIVRVKILALTCTTNNTTVTEQFATEIQIAYTNTLLPAQQIALPVTTSAAAITVVAIAVAYHTTDDIRLSEINKPVWMPAAIIDALFN